MPEPGKIKFPALIKALLVILTVAVLLCASSSRTASLATYQVAETNRELTNTIEKQNATIAALASEVQYLRSVQQEVAFKVSTNVNFSDLLAGQQLLDRIQELPAQNFAQVKQNRIQLRFDDHLKHDGTLFGMSIRNGQVIHNHAMRRASSYHNEWIHPLADTFVLVVYRRGEQTVNGQTRFGVFPHAKCVIAIPE